MIDDEELRNIFKTSSEEHLQNLDVGLLRLEKEQDNQTLLEELLREAHSLKGDANMLGIKDLGTLAHQTEYVFTQLKHHQIEFSQELGDRLAHSITAMSRLVHEAVTGEPAGIDPFHVLAVLMGSNGAEKGLGQLAEPIAQVTTQPVELTEQAVTDVVGITEALDPASTEALDPASTVVTVVTADAAGTADNQAIAASEPDRLEPIAVKPADGGVPISPAVVIPNAPIPQTPGAPSTYRIETIRVPTRSLDNLMTQAGELTVTKLRIAHRLSEIEMIATLWDEWNRDWLNNRLQRNRTTSNKRRLVGNSHNESTESKSQRIDALINRLRGALYEDTKRLELISDELADGISTLRLLPLSTIFNLFPRMVRDLARQEDKQVELVIEGRETCADKRILEEIKDPLMHLLRNAIDHGIESPAQREQLGKPATATIHLRSYQTSTHIVIESQDDGRGLDLNQIKQTALKRKLYREEDLGMMTDSQIQSLIFTPGFSTALLVTEVSGRGVGLDVVQTNVEKFKGTVEVKSTPGQGCLFRIQLAITLTTAHVLIVLVNNTPYAIPVEFVRTACLINPDDIFTLESRATIVQDGQPVSMARLADLLELPVTANMPSSSSGASPQQLACLILQVGKEQLGILVDAVIDEQDVVIKPQSKLLKRVRNVSGATILGTGEVCIVLNPQDLMKSVQQRSPSAPLHKAAQVVVEKPTILLVEDSITIRTQEKRMLEAAGYNVVTAVDGNDGFNKLSSRPFDAVISDVQMPNLDGLQLTSKIRQRREYKELPIVLVTSLASDEDKRRGAEAGANAYITKSNLSQSILVETLQRLI